MVSKEFNSAMSLNIEKPHKRYNILTDEWVLVSPHRTKRPWQGKTEDVEEAKRPTYDPGCYLCPLSASFLALFHIFTLQH